MPKLNSTLTAPQMALLSWKDLEKRYVGRKFVRRKGGKQRTLRIVDCTLGGDVCLREGRYYTGTMPQAEFLEWVRDAKEVASDPSGLKRSDATGAKDLEDKGGQP